MPTYVWSMSLFASTYRVPSVTSCCASVCVGLIRAVILSRWSHKDSKNGYNKINRSRKKSELSTNACSVNGLAACFRSM